MKQREQKIRFAASSYSGDYLYKPVFFSGNDLFEVAISIDFHILLAKVGINAGFRQYKDGEKYAISQILVTKVGTNANFRH